MPETTTTTAAPATAPPSLPGAKPSTPAAAATKAVAAVKNIASEAKPRFNDAFSELDSILSGPAEKKPEAKKTTVGKEEAKSISSKKVELGNAKVQPWEQLDETKSEESKEAEGETATSQADEPEATEESKQEGKGPEKKKPSPVDSLRDAYERSKSRVKELEDALKKAQETPREDPEKKTLSERLEQIDKKRRELEDEIRYVQYEKSPEYKEKYLTPLENALKAAYAEVVDFDVTDQEGNTRKATVDDFNAILSLPPSKAAALAKQLFGDGESAVTAMRLKIRELDQAARSASDEWRKNGSEREKQRMEEMTRRRETLSKMWEKRNQEAADKYPQWFKPEDGDEKGNTLLEKGFQLADIAFSGADKLPPEQMVEVHAAVRNKAAGFDRMVYRNKRLAERVKELEAELAEFHKSQPEEAEGKHVPKSGPTSWEDELDALTR